ncbi:hypothetical protein ES704_03661 [subsurface metagenome]|jgi:hypothetical protein
MYINLPLIFKNKIVSIIGGGSSLIGFDFNRVQGKIIAINQAIKYVKADMFIGLETIMWSQHEKELDELEKRGGYLLNDSRRYTPRQNFTRIVLEPIKDLNVTKANNSGYLALAVALYLGAKRVYLFGFDAYIGSQSHFHRNYDYKSKNPETLTNHLYLYRVFKDAPVINVGLKSKIKYFKKVDINSEIYMH